MGHRNDYLLGILACSAYFGIFVFVYWDIFVAIWRDPTAASWAQAFGTVAAVFGAAMTTVWQERRRQRETLYARQVETKALAVTVMPGIAEIRAFLARLRRRIAANKVDPARPLRDYPNVIEALDFQLPVPMERNIDRLHLLGFEMVEFAGVITNLSRTRKLLETAPDAGAVVVLGYIPMLDVCERAAYRAVYYWYYFGEPEKQAEAMREVFGEGVKAD